MNAGHLLQIGQDVDQCYESPSVSKAIT